MNPNHDELDRFAESGRSVSRMKSSMKAARRELGGTASDGESQVTALSSARSYLLSAKSETPWGKGRINLALNNVVNSELTG